MFIWRPIRLLNYDYRIAIRGISFLFTKSTKLVSSYTRHTSYPFFNAAFYESVFVCLVKGQNNSFEFE